jgi:lycopene beta-cyclase
MEKPVIILGGGYLGTLLALRLKETRPDIPFLLYEESSSLGAERSEFFFDNTPSFWLTPFLTKTWGQASIGENQGKPSPGKWHYIDGHFFHHYARSVLGKCLKLNQLPTPEGSLQESTFVIDARNNGHLPKTYFQIELSMEIVLVNEHGLKDPLVGHRLESGGSKEITTSIFPLGPRRIFVRQNWILEVSSPNWEEMRENFIAYLDWRGWKTSRILKEDRQIMELPLTRVIPPTDARVVSLAGLFHGPRASSIPQMVRIIEAITSGSFRLGEVQRVVKEYRYRFEADARVYYRLNGLAVKAPWVSFHQWLLFQKSDFLQRYFSMKLTRVDRIRINLSPMIWRVKSLMERVHLQEKLRYECQFLK